MKTIFLIRHAKSSWANFDLDDINRPLNDRGKEDAPAMAKRLLKREEKIDMYVSSPAKRAIQTALAFLKVMNVKEKHLVLIDKLYHAQSEIFNTVIAGLDDEHKKIAIFSHNPGITDFANTLCQGTRVDNIPTTGIFAARANVKHWAAFKAAEKEFIFFDFPKNNS
ncbi:MAG: histidine phosphatase family protein [Ferruginibacter sp.]